MEWRFKRPLIKTIVDTIDYETADEMAVESTDVYGR